jgi:hypothetical protein
MIKGSLLSTTAIPPANTFSHSLQNKKVHVAVIPLLPFVFLQWLCGMRQELTSYQDCGGNNKSYII